MNPYMNPYTNPYYGKNPYYGPGTQQQTRFEEMQTPLYYPPQQHGKEEKKMDNFETPDMQGYNPYGMPSFHMYNPYSPQLVNQQPHNGKKDESHGWNKK